MFIPLILCNQLECVVENCDWIIYFSLFCLLYTVFLYCMWLPIWRIKLYIYIALLSVKARAAATVNVHRKFREVWTCGFWDIRTDRQTGRQAHRNVNQPNDKKDGHFVIRYWVNSTKRRCIAGNFNACIQDVLSKCHYSRHDKPILFQTVIAIMVSGI